MDKELNIKKVIFGGYDKDEVNAYINKIRESYSSYKHEAEENTQKLNEKISELEKIISDLKEENKTLKDKSEALSRADFLLSDNAKSIISSLSDDAQNLLFVISKYTGEDIPCEELQPEDNTEEADIVAEDGTEGEIDELINKYL